jgi:hypothetical protein
MDTTEHGPGLDFEKLEVAVQIIRDTLWMAQRYANGRQSYAPGIYNDAARKALRLGFVSAEPNEVLWAIDGTQRSDMSGLTEAECFAAVKYKDALAAANARIAELEAQLAALPSDATA